MDKAVIATIQQQMRVFEKQEDYQEDVFRYMRMARAKRANLVIFPALSPTMFVPSLVSSPRLGLMKRAEKGRGRWASFRERFVGRAADAAGQALGGGLRAEMKRLLNKVPEALYESYVDLFSATALKFKTTVVAGSLYLRLSEESNSKHLCFVFGPDGQIIGRQEKVHLTVEEMSFCQAGDGFTAIDTDVGRIGILIGEDALFPESGRLLAYQGCDLLVNLVAGDGPQAFHQLRHNFIARLDENELMGAQSCLVGPNRLTGSGQDFVGKSGLFSPIPLSPRIDGILFEMGAMTVEGVIAETLDLGAMREHWKAETPRLRQGMRMLAYQPLSAAYGNLRTLDQAYYAPEEEHQVSPDVSATEALPGLSSPEEEGSPPWASTPPDDEFTLEEDDPEQRKLNLRGLGSQDKGFDLLASPFSSDDLEDDNDD
jgi:predicted amidohydrolase